MNELCTVPPGQHTTTMAAGAAEVWPCSEEFRQSINNQHFLHPHNGRQTLRELAFGRVVEKREEEPPTP